MIVWASRKPFSMTFLSSLIKMLHIDRESKRARQCSAKHLLFTKSHHFLVIHRVSTFIMSFLLFQGCSLDFICQSNIVTLIKRRDDPLKARETSKRKTTQNKDNQDSLHIVSFLGLPSPSKQSTSHSRGQIPRKHTSHFDEENESNSAELSWKLGLL